MIVNPNQPDCGFESKALAGVGVVFYVLLATRAELRARGCFDGATQPRLDSLLDLVALGTVADVVRLDANNRRLVAQGLRRIRSGRMHSGVAALFQVAGRDPRRAATFDFGFALGPRINAAGRLSDMTLGIECLLSDDPARALALAQALDGINRQRREVESGMHEQAQAWLERLLPAEGGALPSALSLFDPQFHEGVVGIVAGRLKDRLHRPAFVFARRRRAAEGVRPFDPASICATRSTWWPSGTRRCCGASAGMRWPRAAALTRRTWPPSTWRCSRWPPSGWMRPR